MIRKSFTVRLAAAFVGTGIVAAAVTAIFVNVAFERRFDRYLEEQQMAREDRLAGLLAESYQRMNGWDLNDLDSVARLALMDGGSFRLEGPQDDTIWDASQRSLGPHFTRVHRAMMAAGGPLTPERRVPIEVAGRPVGTAVVRLPAAGVLSHDLTFRQSIDRILLLAGLAAGVLALVLGIFLAGRATRPARELTQVARGLAAGDRALRVNYRGTDEFGEMARAFNAMADAVEREDQLRRTFAADVAHELRTPLAILRSQVEGIQDGLVPSDATTLASLHEEVLRVSQLVADLETMASADAVGFSLAREPVELARIVREVGADFRPMFEERDIELGIAANEVAVVGDRARLQQIVTNLLSNALKFTPRGGRVEVRVWREGEVAKLAVADSGPGITPAELPHVFERFYRGHDASAGGSGIGLAVVAQLVEAHGGRVHVVSPPGAGARFEVELPLPSSGIDALFTVPSWPSPSVGVERRREQ